MKASIKFPAVVALLALVASCNPRDPSAWDVAHKACEIAMSARTDTQAEATRRDLSVADWAAFVCGLSDVIEHFVVGDAPNVAAEHAAQTLRAKGIVK